MQMMKIGKLEDDNSASPARLAERAYEYADRYETPLTPEVFTVWYTYFKRENKVVNEFMDRCMNMGEPLSEASLTEFYHQVLSPRAMSEEMNTMSSKLSNTMGDVADAVETNIKDQTAFSGALKSAKQSLVHGTSKREVAAIITQLHKVNQQHIASAQRMTTQLEKNRAQVSKLERELAEVRRTANLDFLTKLPNRRRLDDLMDQSIFATRQKGQPLCFVLADIDHLSRVNDQFGFSAGDNVLKTYAKEMKKHLVGAQVAARFAGAKFAMMLPDTTAEETMEALEKFSASFKRIDWISGETGEPIGVLTSSFGMGMLDGTESKEQLIDRVDRLLTDAKQQGRDCIVKG